MPQRRPFIGDLSVQVNLPDGRARHTRTHPVETHPVAHTKPGHGELINFLKLLGCKHLPSFNHQLCHFINEFLPQGHQLLLLRKEGCVVNLGIGEKLPHLQLLLVQLISRISGLTKITIPQTQHLFEERNNPSSVLSVSYSLH
jgi:hypothetical protein